MRGPAGALLAAVVLALLGLLHLILPDRAWQLYRRPQLYPEPGTRVALRVLGVMMIGFAGVVP